MKVVPIRDENALCLDRKQLSDALRAVAKRLERGDIDAIRVAMVFEATDGSIGLEAFGDVTTRAYLVGLLEFAKLKVATQ